MTALFPFMKQLVTSGRYDVTGDDGKNEKHKVNLLNASERYYIANEVVSRLEAINTDLFILAWQVRTLSWNDLWFSVTIPSTPYFIKPSLFRTLQFKTTKSSKNV